MINKTPPGWKKAILSELGNWFGGGTPSKSNKDYWINGSIAWVSPKDMNTKKINKTIDYITKEAVTGSSTKIIPKNSILFVTRSGILRNKLPIAINEIDVAINQDIKAFVPDYKIDFSYLVQYLWANESFLLKSCVKTGTTVESVDYDQLKQFSCIYPHMQEQKKIAEILSTWDQAIEKTQKLIELKQSKYLLEEDGLINRTPKQSRYCLTELGYCYSGLTGKNKEDFGEGSNYIPYMKVYENRKVNIIDLPKVAVQENEKQSKVRFGDILFTTSSETPEEVGLTSVLLNNIDNTYLNSFCFGFRLFDFDKLCPFYAQYLLRHQSVRNKLIKLAQGSTRFNLSKREVMKIELELPTLSQQKKISSLLETLEKEIEIHKNIKNFFYKQKQGLMQKLLTGEWRVPLDQEAGHG